MSIVPEKVLLIKYGEIALKGLNRSVFEKLLVNNVARAIKNYGKFKIEREQSTLTIFAESPETDDVTLLIPVLSKIFGIAVISPAYRTVCELEAIKDVVREYIAPEAAKYKTFGVYGKRSDKRFPLSSPALAAEVGGAILETAPGLKVNLTNPEISVAVEIRSNGAFLHAAKYTGAGGMPVGSNGYGLLLLSGGIDSPVAGYMIARRGMRVSALHFTSEPYTSPRAREKVSRLAKIIAAYLGPVKFYTVSLTEIQELIKKHCDLDYNTIILRRFMMRIAERIAERDRYHCLITGDSLGQVASQTIEAMNVVGHVTSLPILRPCIGLDKSQIIETAQKIGTFETSVEPYDDCCAIFSPRHPVTKPKLAKVEEEEGKLHITRNISHDTIDGGDVLSFLDQFSVSPNTPIEILVAEAVEAATWEFFG
ncbi:putative tRNA sulfurtransferase [Clostridia bacterium]|nr:putative tRNA sulfurtransferase [Clostridia bacterium]